MTMSRRSQTETCQPPSLTDQVKQEVKSAENNFERALTVLWNDIPKWQQDNQYITSGYRPPTNSYKRSLASLGYIHNETVNIYTHLLGALAAILGSVYLYNIIHPRYEHATKDDVAVIACYFFGAASCLGMSATYHTISNHSPSVNRVGNQLDYVGIVCLIWGSFVPSIYYGFYQEPTYRWIYWTMITVIGAGCVTVSVNPKFRTPHWRPFRASMFVAMGLSAAVPVIHGAIIFGIAQLQKQIGLSYVILQGVMYIVGAAIYAARVPEKYKPGTFDIWGSSHQIFHVLVLMAAATHFVGLLKAFDYEHSQRMLLDSAFRSMKQVAGV